MLPAFLGKSEFHFLREKNKIKLMPIHKLTVSLFHLLGLTSHTFHVARTPFPGYLFFISLTEVFLLPFHSFLSASLPH